MEQHRDAPAVVIAALAFLSGISVGQSTTPGSPLSKSPSVTISFFVEDGHGNASAKSVAPADLSVLDKEKHQQTILSMRTAKDLPLRIGYSSIAVVLQGTAICMVRPYKQLLISSNKK